MPNNSDIAAPTAFIAEAERRNSGPRINRRLSIALSWSMSRSESCNNWPAAGTRIRSGSALEISFVVRGTMYVEGWPASSNACDWITRTGRVFPGSVPCGGLRSASQTSPRLGIWIPLDCRKLGVDSHALVADPPGQFGQPFGAHARFHFSIHATDCEPNVLGSGNPKTIRQARTLREQLVR